MRIKALFGLGYTICFVNDIKILKNCAKFKSCVYGCNQMIA